MGRVASLFSLFGVFDAKGGEVVLLGVSPWDLHGSGTSICFYHFVKACDPFYLKFELFALFVVWLLCVRLGFNIYVENYVMM